MDIQQIQDSLRAIYATEHKRIVFWYDAHKEFLDILPSLNLDDININSLNGTQVIITADHGFIYQEKAPDALDKSALDTKPFYIPTVNLIRMLLNAVLFMPWKAGGG